jgi:acetyl-CoA acetyltransferase
VKRLMNLPHFLMPVQPPQSKTMFFEQEIVPVTVKSRRSETVITHKDEDHVVKNTTAESLSKLPTAFGP